jgi:micrococcal nuclease
MTIRTLGAAVLVGLAACTAGADPPVSVTTPSPAPEAAPTATASPSAPPTPAGETANVTRVIDGDTIEVSVAGRTHRLRYIGIDTPERGACFFDAATERNRRLVGGRTVRLERDVSETDRYGRLLRYVYAGETFVNAALVREGFANASTYPPDVAHAEEFVRWQAEARKAQRGLWAPTACAPAVRLVTAAPVPVPTSGACHPSYPDFCIPPPPPDLDCPEIGRKDFTVRWDVPSPDPHGFDRDRDGVGCES